MGKTSGVKLYKIGKDRKNLISAFALFSTATAKVLFLEKRMDSMLSTNVSTQFQNFSSTLQFADKDAKL